MEDRQSVTAVIKARNESAQIRDAIRSARLLATDVIVIDDASTDGTAAIAAEEGARVLQGIDHHGHIDLLDKQGFEAVASGWILRMDADERLTDELVQELKSLAADPLVAGARYARLNVMFGKGVQHGGWFEPHQLGFFRAESWDRTWTSAIHSQVPIAGTIAVVNPERAWMVHFDYRTVEEFVLRTLNSYAQVEAAEMAANGLKFSKHRILITPFLRIWGRYFIRRGYRDGNRGLVLAGLLGAYDITRWGMLWDIERQRAEAAAPTDENSPPSS